MTKYFSVKFEIYTNIYAMRKEITVNCEECNQNGTSPKMKINICRQHTVKRIENTK